MANTPYRELGGTRRTVRVALTGALLLAACGGGGSGGSAPLPSITGFTASRTHVERGDTVILQAAFSGGEGFVSEGPGPVRSGVPVQVSPWTDTSYVLTVSDRDGNVATASIHVRAFDHVVSSTDDVGPGTLRQAIVDAGASDGGTLYLDVAGTIALETDLPAIRVPLSIEGPGGGALEVSGNELHRVLFVDGGVTVSLSNFTVSHGLARGGNGSRTNEFGSGGGGAGIGGGLFVNDGVVALDGMTFDQCSAIGGSGGGEPAPVSEVGGGGGLRDDGHLDGQGGDGTPLAGKGGASGRDTTSGDGRAGEDGAGGGGAFAADRRGGSGGFGGGGGGGGTAGLTGGSGGPGGFGGGGGGGGWRPAAPAAGGAGGFAGGAGGAGSTNGGRGGGGGGLGGAIFVRAGFLQLTHCTFSMDSASGGPSGTPVFGAVGQPGEGKGGAVFIMDGALAAGSDLTFSGNSAADAVGVAGDDDDVFGTITPL